MEKIASFTIDHIKLQPGIYVSRTDDLGSIKLTTYDLRMKMPNREPVIGTGEIHAIEHLGATFLRNHEGIKDDVIYFGPMGCRTGFYLILKGNRTPDSILPLIKEMFEYIERFEDDIPGASAKDCGNYLDMNLPMARFEAGKYFNALSNIKADQLTYPE